MLHLVQSEDGYVSPRGIAFCAAHLGLSTAEVSAVATFYTQYKRHPNGTYTVGVCTNTLCAIMGGDAIWEDLSDHLGIGHDETTDDGVITLERVECNAACDYAPVVMVNWEFFDNQTPDSARQLADDLPRASRSSRRAARTASARSRRCPACWPASATGGPTRASAPACRRCAVSSWPGPRAGPRRSSPTGTTAAAGRRRHGPKVGGEQSSAERPATTPADVSPAAEQKKQSTDDAKES